MGICLLIQGFRPGRPFLVCPLLVPPNGWAGTVFKTGMWDLHMARITIKAYQGEQCLYFRSPLGTFQLSQLSEHPWASGPFRILRGMEELDAYQGGIL